MPLSINLKHVTLRCLIVGVLIRRAGENFLIYVSKCKKLPHRRFICGCFQIIWGCWIQKSYQFFPITSRFHGLKPPIFAFLYFSIVLGFYETPKPLVMEENRLQNRIQYQQLCNVGYLEHDFRDFFFYPSPNFSLSVNFFTLFS